MTNDSAPGPAPTPTLTRGSFDAVFEAAGVGTCVSDLQGRLISVNRALQELLGYEASELRGMSFTEFTHPEDAPAQLVLFRELVEGKRTSYQVEKRYRRKDGRALWVRVTESLAPEDGGVPAHTVALVENITAYKQAEEALERSHNQLEAMFQSLTDPIFVQDGEGHVVYANDSAAHSMGYPSASDLMARRVPQVLDRYDLLNYRGESMSRSDLPAQRAIHTGRPAEATIRFRRHGESEDRVSAVKATPLLGHDGGVELVVSVYEDITERERMEQALRASETRFRTIIEQSPLSTQIFAPDGSTMLVNRAWEELWGVTLEAIGGYNILQDRQLEEKGIMPYIRRGFAGEATDIPPIRYEPSETIPNVDAVPFRWVRASIYPVKDESGQIREVVLMHQDITEQREAEDVKAQLAALVESSDDAIIGKTMEGIITSWNSGAQRIYGYTAEEVIGRPINILVPPERPDEIPRIMARLAQGKGIDHYDTIRITRDGRRLDMSLSISPIRDAAGTIVGASTIARDITYRKQSERRLAFLSDASTVLASSLDYETTLTSVARLAVPHIADWCVVDIVTEDGTAERLAAAHVDPAKQAMAREYEQSYAAEQYNIFNQVIDTGRPYVVPNITDEMLLQSALDQKQLRMLRELGLRSLMAVPIIARNRPMGVITLVAAESGRRYGQDDLDLAEDLAARAAIAIDNAHLFQAERRSRAQAQEALRVREEFLSIASHELKTPLTALSLQIQMLQRAGSGSPERLSSALLGAERQVKRLTSLVEDLLDVSRISAGRLPLEPEEMDLVALVQEVVSRFAGELAASGSSLTLDTDQPVVGWWDRSRVDQIVTNLLDNAIKYGQGQPIALSVDTCDSMARLTVRDQGIGISSEDFGRVFDRFVRLNAARNYGGLGLGLHIVRQLVDAHGGEVRVESQKEAGTTFRVLLPLR